MKRGKFLFAGPASYLYDHFFSGKRFARSRLREEVEALQCGRRNAFREYQIRKIARVMLALLCSVLLLAAAVLFTLLQGRSVPEGRLRRNGYGMADQLRELAAQVEHESEAQLYPVSIRARRYSPSQVRDMLEEAGEEFDSVMTGDNASRDHVSKDLVFPAGFQGGAVQASYMTVPYGMISEEGRIVGEPDREGSLVEITATFTCQGESLIRETAVMVFPGELTAREQLRADVIEALERADEEQAESEYLTLPGEVSGRQIVWREPGSEGWKVALAWMILLPALIWLGWDAKIHALAKERNEQLLMDLPDLLWRLTMLLGAGMSVRQAFTRIAAGYEEGGRDGRERFICSEMRYTLREMENGTGEGAAYEHFGRRCALPGYIKLGSLLTMSLKKGTNDLRQTLEKEASQAMEERKNLALRMGERAGTKMLFPMILMLGVVLMVLILPAFMSMG